MIPIQISQSMQFSFSKIAWYDVSSPSVLQKIYRDEEDDTIVSQLVIVVLGDVINGVILSIAYRFGMSNEKLVL